MEKYNRNVYSSIIFHSPSNGKDPQILIFLIQKLFFFFKLFKANHDQITRINGGMTAGFIFSFKKSLVYRYSFIRYYVVREFLDEKIFQLFSFVLEKVEHAHLYMVDLEHKQDCMDVFFNFFYNVLIIGSS